MKRPNIRLISLFLSAGLVCLGVFAYLKAKPETALLACRAHQIYAFSPGRDRFLGWQSDHSFLCSSQQFALNSASTSSGVCYHFDLDSRQEEQLAYTPKLAKQRYFRTRYYPAGAFQKPFETYAKQVASGPQGHAEIQFSGGSSFNSIWPLASYVGKQSVIFTDLITRKPSRLEQLWQRYVLRVQASRPKDFVRIWICHRDGTGLRMLGEGPLMPASHTFMLGVRQYTLQCCRLSDDEKTLRFVWGGGVWSIPCEN